MKWISKLSMLLVTLVLCGMLMSLLHNQQARFYQVETDYREGRAVNLSYKIDKDNLAQILLRNGYVTNESDARFIADTLAQRLQRMSFPNLYHLQKRAYGQVPAAAADSAHVLQNMLDRSNRLIGLCDTMPSLQSLTSTVIVDSAARGEIVVQLYVDKQASNRDLSNAVVRLTEYSPDTANHVRDTVIAFAKTDSLGVAVFRGLKKDRAYSVLPVKRGSEYGSTKGIVLGKFKRDSYTFRFEQIEHRIQMISNATIKMIKNDGTITVRTPEEYKTAVIKWFVLLLLAWWGLAVLLRIRRRDFDPLLLSSAMFLSCLCVLVMFSIQDPLTEELRGVEMASAVLMGVVAIFLLQLIDFVRLYQNGYAIPFDLPLAFVRWLFLPFKQKVSWIADTLTSRSAWYKKLGAFLLLLLSLPFAIFNIPGISKINRPILRFLNRLPKGFGWILSAILLTALLWTPLGREVGGMKVNLSILGLVFQPSEIAKYLILFFMAAFFTQNADSIIAYSQPNRLKIRDKFRTMSWVLFGLLTLFGLYAVLGDMGPGLVLGITFVLLYSLVKSKVNLDNLSDDDKWRRIFTCDFAMLIYGVLSFGACVLIGFSVGADLALFMAALWFVGWIVMGMAWHKQFFETAFVMNLLVFLFVFGGQIMHQLPAVRNTSAAERFEQRTDMCVNTWGYLDEEYEGRDATPVMNTQVVNGLWALATGGMNGQGLGQGNPSFVPAFHTDMILSSIGEQLGWWGLVVIALALGILLRRLVVVGYRVGHSFAFYFCMGAAIIIGVQFFIIALGGSGMIPLTGITVPLLSYGRVSMILNLAALGIILSMSAHMHTHEHDEKKETIRHRTIGGYNFPISIVTWTFIVMMLFTLGVWQHYALWHRNTTLVRPAYVLNREGLPVIEYNPRIALITSQMWAGNIYDRNGILLATSDREKLDPKSSEYADLKAVPDLDMDAVDSIAKTHTRRYYPFGEQLFFMLGDQNSGILFTYDENNPIGYMAEAQHLSYLRDYDNLHDSKGRPTKVVRLTSHKVKPDARYARSCVRDTTIRYRLRDNHELVDYLKTGIDGSPLRRHNEEAQSGNFDLHLTLDADLQVAMQNKLKNHVSQKWGNNNLLRISVVVLDAENGDMLASANYPLPDCNSIMEADQAGERYYNDNKRPKSWRAYTDRDLGLTYATPPGSTAKVMTAMAGLNKLGAHDGAHTAFDIWHYEGIDYNGAGALVEPPYGASHAVVEMRQALVESSNCYFIDLLHDRDLYESLEPIYANVGIRLENKCTYNLRYPDSLDTYLISPIVRRQRQVALTSWERYQLAKSAHRYVNGKDQKTLRRGEWMWAWGQGTLDATPLAMARVVSAVQNRGQMPYTRYLMDEEKHTVQLTTPENAQAIKEFMRGQYENNKKSLGTHAHLGGKTGTPHRTLTPIGCRSGKNHRDGWYIFYIDNSAAGKQSLAVAVRMERVGAGSSTTAMQLSRDVVIPVLEDYISKQR